MADALYGPGGFYRCAGAPGRHFRTAARVSPRWAETMLSMADEIDRQLGEPAGFTVVDMGAGGGELIGGLAALAPQRWRLVGVDVAPRPVGLPDRVMWTDVPPARFDGVLLAVEWLDVVPVDVVEQAADGVRLVEVSDAGEERLGDQPGADDLEWLARWWPLAEKGDRAEVGRSRDEAWAGAVDRVERGLALAVDYAAVPSRDVAGTLTGFRDGRQVAPVPDGSCDITAHVLMESCAAAAPAESSRLTDQRSALRRLGLSADLPTYAGEPTAYVAALSQAGAAAELLDAGGLGGFTWLLQTKGGVEGSPA
jgi:SAM-dependent MidA family methyltransferase